MNKPFNKMLVALFMVFVALSVLTSFAAFKIALSFALLTVGLLIILRKNNCDCGKKRGVVSVYKNNLEDVFVLDDINQSIEANNLKGGKLVIVGSNVEMDFNKAKTEEKEVQLNIVNVLSKTKIVLPYGWRVDSKGIAIMGGYNIHIKNTKEDDISLVIKGVSILGEVEIVTE